VCCIADITPEIAKQALNDDDLFNQYNAILMKLTTGKIFSKHVQKKYTDPWDGMWFRAKFQALEIQIY
jgi:hypothetical protein